MDSNGWKGWDMKAKNCEHMTTHETIVQGIEGPWRVVYCLKCHAAVSRKPATTPTHIQALRDLAARDGREAGKPKRCTHGGVYLGFGDSAEWCAKCFFIGMDRVLDEVPTERLTP